METFKLPLTQLLFPLKDELICNTFYKTNSFLNSNFRYP